MTCKHTWQFTDGGTGALKCTRCNVETGPRTPEQLTQDMMQDVLTIGSAWSKDGERIDPMSVYRDTEPQYKLHEPRPTSITFFGMKDNANIEVMRLSRDGVWVNPDISCDEAAKKVLEVLDNNLKLMLEKEREAGRKEAEAELDATNRQVEILSDALAESRREVAALKAVQEPVRGWWAHTSPITGITDVQDWQLTKDDKARGWIEREIYTTPPAAQPAVPLTDEKKGNV